MNWARAPIQFHDIGSARATRSSGQRRPPLPELWAGTLLKAFALIVVYLVVLSIALFGVFVYAVLQL